jgi:hypothetical protein
MSVHIPTKAVVTVVEMARMLGLSRARFYQLQKAGVFPAPVYSLSNRRPIYVEEMQKVCLEVRRRHCGVNVRPVLFYASRFSSSPRKLKPKPKAKEVSSLAHSLRGLGLTAVTAADVHGATKELFPQGTGGIDQIKVVRVLFLHLKRKNSADKVSR